MYNFGRARLPIGTHKRTRTMLEPDEWDSVLGSVTGTIYRGTERISSNVLLNALGVPDDPSLIPARIFSASQRTAIRREGGIFRLDIRTVDLVKLALSRLARPILFLLVHLQRGPLPHCRRSLLCSRNQFL
jgi:hypothetical protein